MKSFNFEENKKVFRQEIIVKLLVLIAFIIGMMIVGAVCYVGSFFVAITFFGSFPFWEAYQKLFNFGERDIESLFAKFTIQIFAGFSIFSVLAYYFFFWCFKRIKLVRKNYEDLREQIYDVLTMLIFLFGFLPLILKFSIVDKYETLIKEIDTIILIFMIGLLPPYLYSSFSKIYYSIEEKQFSKFLINHMEKKINNNE